MSIDILFSEPVFHRRHPRGTVGDTLTLTSIHDVKSAWAKRKDGMHANIGLRTLFNDYRHASEFNVNSGTYTADADMLSALHAGLFPAERGIF